MRNSAEATAKIRATLITPPRSADGTRTAASLERQHLERGGDQVHAEWQVIGRAPWQIERLALRILEADERRQYLAVQVASGFRERRRVNGEMRFVQGEVGRARDRDRGV